MSVILVTKSLHETSGATLASTATASGFGKERLYDRDRGLLCKANAAGDFDLDLTLSVADSASSLALVNHNQGGNVEVYADTASALGTSLVATLNPTGLDPYYATFTLQTVTKYRLRFKNFGTAFQAGEVLLGVARTVTQDPYYRSGAKVTLGNVMRDSSPAGYTWAVQRGASRVRLPYGWTTLTAANQTVLEAAYADLLEGAKNFVLVDPNSVKRWMTWVSATIEPTFVAGTLTDVKATFEEAI